MLKYRKSKWLILNIIILLLIGILMVYSSSWVWSEYKFGDAYHFLKRQLLFGGVGVIMMFIVSKIDYQLYKKYANQILLGCLISLILVLVPGVGLVRGGSRSWFGVGGFSIQPAEFFKLGMIIFTAKYIEKNYNDMKYFIKGLIPILTIVMLGFGLIMLQPDFGSGMVMVCGIMVMILASPAPFKYFVRLGLVGVLGIVGLIASAPYRLKRITAFLDPFADPLGSGFQAIQALFAIAPGGILGVGFNNSFQKHFYLPEPQTDFIFAIYAEEFGFVGGIVLVGLFLLLVSQGILVATRAPDLFATYVTLGIIGVTAVQILINLGVVVGLFPVTGVTLPFISYGGSSLTLQLIAMGVLINIKNQS